MAAAVHGRDATAMRPAALSLRANFSWTVLGNTVLVLSKWIVLVLLARLGTATMVGQLSIAMAVTAPVFSFAQMSMRSVHVTDVSETYPFGDFLYARRLLAIVALAVVGVLAVTMQGVQPSTRGVVLVVGVWKAIESLQDMHYGALQRWERMDVISHSMVARGVLYLVLLSAVELATDNVLLVVTALPVASLLVLLLFDHRQIKRVVPSVRVRRTHRRHLAISLRLMVVSLPLGIGLLLISLNANIPIYVLTHYFDEATVGYFAALLYMVSSGRIVISALGQAGVPRLAQLFVSNVRGFVRLLVKLSALSFMIGIAGAGISWFVGAFFLKAFYGAEYAPYQEALTWLAVAAAFTFAASTVSAGITASRQFWSHVPQLLVVGGATLVGAIVLIPSYRLVGAAWAVLISGMVQLASGCMVVLWATNRRRAEIRVGVAE